MFNERREFRSKRIEIEYYNCDFSYEIVNVWRLGENMWLYIYICIYIGARGFRVERDLRPSAVLLHVQHLVLSSAETTGVGLEAETTSRRERKWKEEEEKEY